MDKRHTETSLINQAEPEGDYMSNELADLVKKITDRSCKATLRNVESEFGHSEVEK